MRRLIILCAAAALGGCGNPGAHRSPDGKVASSEAAYPTAGKYEVLISHDSGGLSPSGDSFQPAPAVCVSAEEAANPRRLLFGARADCDERHMYFQSGDITADLMCAAPGGEAKNVPVKFYGVYKSNYWRVTEEVRIFGQTQREERIYRRIGNCSGTAQPSTGLPKQP
jgi:hypothetical protein